MSIVGVDPLAPGGEPLQDLFNGRSLPALAMHLIALRKNHDRPFVAPVHVSP